MARFLERMLRPPHEKVGGPSSDPPIAEGLTPGVFWEGMLHGLSGYAKANREIIHRIANSLYVEAVHGIGVHAWSDHANRARVDVHLKTKVHELCPSIRFLGPDNERVNCRHRISWTMMESGRIHQDMISNLNRAFDELWTPTAWNLEIFKHSGLTIPGHVVPLGVDSVIYHPRPKSDLSECLLISTKNAGKKAVPEGFLFLSVSLPSFRKGFDFLARAFEEAFGDTPGVCLVIATTHFSPNVECLSGLESFKSRIYALTGNYTEHGMASIYSSCDAYVSASRGEGWNLPACEASACGLPVIAPRTTSHPEALGEEAWLFDGEGIALYPGSESISPWYKGVPFSYFGKKSMKQLVSMLQEILAGGEHVEQKAASLRTKMIHERSWDIPARMVAERLLELQP
jgi:glycosyltransferase involved in cell wall biosynthesis